MKQFVGHPSEGNRALFDPRLPLMSGVVQNQDSYMKGKIAQRRWYDRVLPTLKAVMDEYSRLSGRKYDVVMPYRIEDAEYAIVGSGCMIETAEASVDYIREHLGIKVGLLHITCWRPFPSIEVVEALRHCKAISVVERLDVPMMQSNPLLCEIKASFADAVSGTPGYPKYGSEKKGLPTTYYLTIAKDHIKVHSELEHVEFIPLNDVNAFNLENPLAGLSDNGMVFVQSPKTETAEIWAAIPAWARRSLIQNNARVFALDTVKIAKEV